MGKFRTKAQGFGIKFYENELRRGYVFGENDMEYRDEYPVSFNWEFIAEDALISFEQRQIWLKKNGMPFNERAIHVS